MKSLDKYITILESIGEYFFISLLLGISVTVLVESWRTNLSYLLAAVAFGTFLGYGVMNISVGNWSSFAILATIIGTITGPATVAALQKKTVLDVAKEAAETAANRRTRSPSHYPRSPYPRRSGSSSDARKLPTQGDPSDKGY